MKSYLEILLRFDFTSIHLISRLEKDLESNLRCLLGEKTSESRKLKRCIEGMLDTIKKRVSVTEELMEVEEHLNKISP